MTAAGRISKMVVPYSSAGCFGHELLSVIHVAGFKDKNAAELFLGFGVGTVGGCDFAVLPIQG